MGLNKIKWLYKKAMMLNILHLPKLVYRKKQSHDSFSFGSDNQIGLQQPMSLESHVEPLRPFLVKRQSTYSKIGVGVYQGECVIFHRWASPDGTETHPWVFDKITYQNLENIEPEVVEQLFCFACFVAQNYRQSYSVKKDLQWTIGKELSQCPYKHGG